MESMDSVEREFESRDMALQEMTGQQARLEDWGHQVRARLSQAEQVISGQKRELEKSLAAQKTLIHQLQLVCHPAGLPACWAMHQVWGCPHHIC